jgi:hypothetical protein
MTRSSKNDIIKKRNFIITMEKTPESPGPAAYDVTSALNSINDSSIINSSVINRNAVFQDKRDRFKITKKQFTSEWKGDHVNSETLGPGYYK